MSRSRPWVVLVCVFILLAAGCTTSLPVTTVAVSTPSAIRVTSTPAVRCVEVMTGGAYPQIPSISSADLFRCRPEARTVAQTIKNNGPFKYDRDDIVFGNREGILPPKTSGTYHEYTVDTPGASNRGTRRIITSGDPNRSPKNYDQTYYSDDHYQTIWLVK